MSKNLLMYTEGQAVKVKLYDTVILTVKPQESVSLSMGGWHTQTTVKHLNRALSQNNIPLTVYTENGRALVLHSQTGVKHKFFDGIQFDIEGALLS